MVEWSLLYTTKYMMSVKKMTSISNLHPVGEKIKEGQHNTHNRVRC